MIIYDFLLIGLKFMAVSSQYIETKTKNQNLDYENEIETAW